MLDWRSSLSYFSSIAYHPSRNILLIRFAHFIKFKCEDKFWYILVFVFVFVSMMCSSRILNKKNWHVSLFERKQQLFTHDICLMRTGSFSFLWTTGRHIFLVLLPSTLWTSFWTTPSDRILLKLRICTFKMILYRKASRKKNSNNFPKEKNLPNGAPKKLP